MRTRRDIVVSEAPDYKGQLRIDSDLTLTLTMTLAPTLTSMPRAPLDEPTPLLGRIAMLVGGNP